MGYCKYCHYTVIQVTCQHFQITVSVARSLCASWAFCLLCRCSIFVYQPWVLSVRYELLMKLNRSSKLTKLNGNVLVLASSYFAVHVMFVFLLLRKYLMWHWLVHNGQNILVSLNVESEYMPLRHFCRKLKTKHAKQLLTQPSSVVGKWQRAWSRDFSRPMRAVWRSTVTFLLPSSFCATVTEVRYFCSLLDAVAYTPGGRVPQI